MKTNALIILLCVLLSVKAWSSEEILFNCPTTASNCNSELAALFNVLNNRTETSDLTVHFSTTVNSLSQNLATINFTNGAWLKLDNLPYKLTFRGVGSYNTVIKIDNGSSFVVKASPKFSIESMSFITTSFNSPIYVVDTSLSISNSRFKNHAGKCLTYEGRNNLNAFVEIKNTAFENCRDSITISKVGTLELKNNIFNYYGASPTVKGIRIEDFDNYLIDGNHFYGYLAADEFYIKSKDARDIAKNYNGKVINNYFETMQGNAAILAEQQSLTVQKNFFFYLKTSPVIDKTRIKHDGSGKIYISKNLSLLPEESKAEGLLPCIDSNYCSYY